MEELKNEQFTTGQVLSKTFRIAAAGLGVLAPTIIITYLIAFGGATLRFHNFPFHEVAVVVAVISSGFIGWVALLNYRRSGEEYQRWVALAYISFTLIYIPHGILTRLADTNISAFLIFGPASRLAMSIYLLTAILCFGKKVERKQGLWPHIVGCLILITALGIAGLAGWINIPQVRGMEMTSNVVFSLTVLTMLVKWRPEHLLKYHLVALFWFIQASAAFLLSKPWSHLWWSAHLISAVGFIILGYAILRAQQATGAFAQVFSTAQLHRQLRENAVLLEREKKEQVVLIEQLRQTTESLEQSNRDLEQFVYSVSHDLRSPLVTVKTFVDILRQDLQVDNQPQINEDLNYIDKASDKMQQLLDALLQYSRIGRINSPAQVLSTCQSVEDCLTTLAGILQKHQVQVLTSELPQQLHGAPLHFGQIWQNLIENAVKYRGEQAQLHIEVGATQQGHDVVFYVRDNGMGIPPKQSERIFNLFSQLNAGSDGSGLGLALVKKIVSIYQGRIWVESAGPGTGSCFMFTLPSALIKEDTTT